MLSSVSHVCLGMCTDINLGGQVLSFISVLLFQGSGLVCF